MWTVHLAHNALLPCDQIAAASIRRRRRQESIYPLLAAEIVSNPFWKELNQKASQGLTVSDNQKIVMLLILFLLGYLIGVGGAFVGCFICSFMFWVAPRAANSGGPGGPTGPLRAPSRTPWILPIQGKCHRMDRKRSCTSAQDLWLGCKTYSCSRSYHPRSRRA